MVREEHKRLQQCASSWRKKRMLSADEMFDDQYLPPSRPCGQLPEETEALAEIQRRLETLQSARVGSIKSTRRRDGTRRPRAMRINKIERNYIIFWGIVEVVAISPFYYLCYKIWKGWPNEHLRGPGLSRR
jgi:hypothetical protein